MTNEEVIENVAKEIHNIQIESAKLHDAHTEGVEVYYIDWDELHEDMRVWYREKAKSIIRWVV